MGIGSIFSALLGLGGQWLESKQKVSALRIENELALEKAKVEAEIERLRSAQNHEQNWDQIVASQMDNSWKDEWITFLVSVPMIMMFWSDEARERVRQGFEAFQSAPDWFIYTWLTVVAASFGVRQLLRVVKR